MAPRVAPDEGVATTAEAATASEAATAAWGRAVSTARPASAAAWERRLVRILLATDAAAAVLCVAVAGAMRGESVREPGAMALLAAVPALWLLSLGLARAYEPRFLGVGSEEFRRVGATGVCLIATVATGSWLLGTDAGRGLVLAIAAPVLLLSLVQRGAIRAEVHRRRSRGDFLHRVVVVGHVASSASLVRQMRRSSYQGMQVVAACVPSGRPEPELASLGIPVLSDLDGIVEVVERVHADTVAVLACPEIDGPGLRRLGWALEASETDLIVAPALTDQVGSRIAVRQVCGLSLLHVERPELRGLRRVAKGLLDRVGAALALVALSPFLLVIAVCIRLDGPGRVFFCQSRVGQNGKPFLMWKFRTMSHDAEKRRDELLAVNEASGLLFKIRNDPRVTRVGRRLRRYSLDELPQLANVLLGHMSLVGPRPPLPGEVARYDDLMHRRLAVKPGVTGLWQISGRADLDWAESLRLDLRYVDNWSFALDLLIMWKTLFAVVRGSGAY